MQKIVSIAPLEEPYQQEAMQMMKKINEEFLLPQHHPAYMPVDPDYYWMAMADGHVVGTVALLLKDDYAVLKRMFVKKEFRGPVPGTAKLLLHKAIAQCGELGVRRIYLGTLEVLVAAQRFYEKSGFSKISLAGLPASFPHNLSDNAFYTISLKTPNDRDEG